MPRHLDGDHDERYDQVGDGQMHDVEVDPRATPPAAEQDDEDDEVADSGDEEHEAVRDDGEDAVIAERQRARQSDVHFAARC